MSATVSTIVRPAVAKGPGISSRLFSACLDGIAGYFVSRAAVACLRELDDRELRDIGLVRSQIEAAVRGFVIAPKSGEAVMMASPPALPAVTREAAPWS